MKIKLRDGELAFLIRNYPCRRPVDVSFGPGGAWLDDEKDPESAKLIQDRRDEMAGVLVTDGFGI